MSIDLDVIEANVAAGDASQEERLILSLLRQRDAAQAERDALRAKLAAAEAERDRYTKHADEGWALANRRTEQWKQVEAERDEARRIAAGYDRSLRDLLGTLDSARRAARAWKASAGKSRIALRRNGLRPDPMHPFGWTAVPMTALTVDQDSMIMIDGKSFRCPGDGPGRGCGCNVFRRLYADERRYKCNACGAIFVGERAARKAGR